MAFTKPSAATQVGSLALFAVTQSDGSQKGLISAQPVDATGAEVGPERRLDATDELTPTERNQVQAILTRLRSRYNTILGS